MQPSHVIQQMVSCKLAEEKLRRKDKTSSLLLAQTSALTLSLPAAGGVGASLAVARSIAGVWKVFGLDVAEVFLKWSEIRGASQFLEKCST